MFSLLCFTITSQAQTKTEKIDFTGMSGRGIEVKKIERSGVILLFDGGGAQYVPAFYDKKNNEEAALRMYYGNILTVKGKQSKIKEIHFKFATKAKTKLTTLKVIPKDMMSLKRIKKDIDIWSSLNGVDSVMFILGDGNQVHIKILLSGKPFPHNKS